MSDTLKLIVCILVVLAINVVAWNDLQYTKTERLMLKRADLKLEESY